jgi:hypothetical protein
MLLPSLEQLSQLRQRHFPLEHAIRSQLIGIDRRIVFDPQIDVTQILNVLHTHEHLFNLCHLCFPTRFSAGAHAQSLQRLSETFLRSRWHC